MHSPPQQRLLFLLLLLFLRSLVFLVLPIEPIHPMFDRRKTRESRDVRMRIVASGWVRGRKTRESGREEDIFASCSASFSDFPRDAAFATLIHREATGISRGWERWIRPQRACPREAWFILSLFESGRHNSGPFRRQLFTLPRLAHRARHGRRGGGANGWNGGSLRRGINRYRTLLEPPGRRQVRNNVLLTVVEKLQRYAVQIQFFLIFYLFKKNVDSYSVEN